MRGRPGSLLVSNSSSLSSSSQLCYQSSLCTAEAGVQSTMYEHLRQSNKYNASKPWNNTIQKQGASTLGGQEARQLNSLIKALEVRTDLLTQRLGMERFPNTQVPTLDVTQQQLQSRSPVLGCDKLLIRRHKKSPLPRWGLPVFACHDCTCNWGIIY